MSVKANIVANFIGQGWRTLMGLAFIPLYIRYLGLESYGLIGIFFVLQAWLGLMDMGIRPALGREMARFTAGAHDSESIRNLLRSAEVVVACIAIALALLVWVSSEWLAKNWVVPEALTIQTISNSFTLMGVVVALSLVESVYVSSISGLQRQIAQNVVGSVIATLRAVGALCVLWTVPSIEAFFIWQGAVSALSIMIFSTMVHRSIPASPTETRFSSVALREIQQFAGGVAAITFLGLLLTQVDKLLLSRLLNLADFGSYALAALVTGGLYTLAIPFTSAFYPRFTQLVTKGSDDALCSEYHLGAQLVTVFMGSAALVLIFFSKEIIFVWTSDAMLTEQVSPLVTIMAIGTLLNGLMWIPYQLQLAHAWTSLAIKTNLVAVAILIPSILWIAPRYGSIGAAWAWVALNSGYVLFSIYFIHRRLLRGEKWRWYGVDVALPLAGAALACLVLDLAFPATKTRAGQIGFLIACATTALLLSASFAPLVRRKALRTLMAFCHHDLMRAVSGKQ